MSLIYFMQANGEQTSLEEMEVKDLLARKVLSRETYFWKEGMDEWRPLSELVPRQQSHFVPARRTPGSVSGLQNPVKTFQSTTTPVRPEPIRASQGSGSESDDDTPVRRKPGRYRLRFNLIPLTVCMQVIYLGLLGAMGYLIYRCLGHIYGWDGGTPATDPLAVLMGNADPSSVGKAGIPAAEMTYLYYFFGTVVGIHVVTEILFFFWIYYANKNCRGMASNMIYTPGWSVAYFFIPIVSWFRPCQVVQELWKVSMNPKGWIGRRGSIFVGIWFAVRLCSLILARGPFRTAYSESDDPAVQAIGILMYLTTVEVVLFLMELTTLILVSVITWRQVRWSRRAGT